MMENIIKFKTIDGSVEFDLFKIIDEKDMWKNGKLEIISYDGCKKLADYFGVVMKETPQFLCQPNAENWQQHIFWMWVWFKGDSNRDNWIYSEWEASQLNTGEMVKDKEGNVRHVQTTKVDSMYKSNMSFKRAYCRWILRILGLIGIYSDIESATFGNIANGEEINYGNL